MAEFYKYRFLEGEFLGVAYNEADDFVISRSPVIRSSLAEAVEDAKAMCKLDEVAYHFPDAKPYVDSIHGLRPIPYE